MSDAQATHADTTSPVQICIRHPLPRPALHSSEVNMALYAAILGKTPEIDPNAGSPLAPRPTVETRPQRLWSPIVLSIYLRQAYRQGAHKLTKPEITAWIHRQSAIARKRLHETHHRLLTATKRAA